MFVTEVIASVHVTGKRRQSRAVSSLIACRMKHSCWRANFFRRYPRIICCEGRATSVKLCQNITINEISELFLGSRVYILHASKTEQAFHRSFKTLTSWGHRQLDKTIESLIALKLGIEHRKELFTLVEIYWKVQKKLLIYKDWGGNLWWKFVSSCWTYTC